MPEAYVCYLLRGGTGRTYIGCTNDLRRRLRQHNGALAGGARATASGRPWILAARVGGFPDQRAALRFEWAWKHRACRRARTRGVPERLRRLDELVAELPLLRRELA